MKAEPYPPTPAAEKECGPHCYRYRNYQDKHWCIRGADRRTMDGQVFWPTTLGAECKFAQSRYTFRVGDRCWELYGSNKCFFKGDGPCLILREKTGSYSWIVVDVTTGELKEIDGMSLYLIHKEEPIDLPYSGKFKIGDLVIWNRVGKPTQTVIAKKCEYIGYHWYVEDNVPNVLCPVRESDLKPLPQFDSNPIKLGVPDRTNSENQQLQAGDWVQRAIDGQIIGKPFRLDHASETEGYDWERKHDYWGVYPGYEFYMPLKESELIPASPPEDCSEQLAEEIAEALPRCGRDCIWYRPVEDSVKYPEGICYRNYLDRKTIKAVAGDCSHLIERKEISSGDMIRAIIPIEDGFAIFDGYAREQRFDIAGKNRVGWNCEVVRVNPISPKYAPHILGMCFEECEIFKIFKLPKRAQQGFGNEKRKSIKKKIVNKNPQLAQKAPKQSPTGPVQISLFSFDR